MKSLAAPLHHHHDKCDIIRAQAQSFINDSIIANYFIRYKNSILWFESTSVINLNFTKQTKKKLAMDKDTSANKIASPCITESNKWVSDPELQLYCK